MKGICLFLLITATTQAQQFRRTPHQDSLADLLRKPMPQTGANAFPEPMPRMRPNNSFYKHWSGPNQALRATLDNMAVKQPDTTQDYPMPRVFPADGAGPNRWRHEPKKP